MKKFIDIKWWVLIAIGISTFMSALDGSVVNTTLPIIKESLNSDIATIEWVVTIYLLVLSGLLLSFGRLGDLRGHKPVYLSGFAVFLIGSMLCGLSKSATALIAFRGLQAMGAAMIQANSPAILTKSFPDNQRGQALGLSATMTYLGLTVGPSLGGWLAENLGWQAIFYINIPVGLIAIWLSARFITNDGHGDKTQDFDFLGAFLFTTGLVLLLLGLNQGHAIGWTSIIIITDLVIALLIMIIFVISQKRAKKPMLDLSLFKNRIFSSAVGSAIFNYISIYSILFLMPFYLIQGRGFTPSQAGLLLTAQPLVMAIVAPLSGSISDRVGTRIPSVIGMLGLTCGLILLSRLGSDASSLQIVIALGTAGFGTGIFISPNNSALMGAAPRKNQGIAAGVLATARNMGMALGVGIAGAIFTTRLAQHANESQVALFGAIQTSFSATAIFALIGCLIAGVRASDKNIKAN
jgi:EmrB/QacA subfamily drug resistance transporter